MTSASKEHITAPMPPAEMYRKLLAVFHPDDRVLVAIVADPDSLASALALKRILWRKVASVTIGVANQISRPDNQIMVRLLKIPLEQLDSLNPQNFSKRVIVDGQPGHNDLFGSLDAQVIIDHHPVVESSLKADFVDIRPRYGANATILAEYLKTGRIKPSARLATALAFGIKNDTAGFQRPCLPEDVAAFQMLFSMASQSVMRKIEFSEMRFDDLAILRKALDSAVLKKNQLYAHLGEVKSPDNLVQAADFFLKLERVDFSVVSGVFEDRLVVIFRNAAFYANAGNTAKQAFDHLGSAGGHKAAARAEVLLASLEPFVDTRDQSALSRFIIRRVQHPSKGRAARPGKNGKTKKG